MAHSAQSVHGGGEFIHLLNLAFSRSNILLRFEMPNHRLMPFSKGALSSKLDLKAMNLLTSSPSQNKN